MKTSTPVSIKPPTSTRPHLRLALRREMTFGEIFKRFPKARLLKMRGLQDVDPVRDANLTVEEYARRFQYGWAFEMSMGTLNNCLVLLENADQQIQGDPTLVDYALFHGLTDRPSPETTRPVVPVKMDEQRLGLICDGGLPYLRWILSDGLNAVQLHQDGPPIEMLSCFQRVAGMSCERIFDGGFLDLRVAGQRHPFDQVHLTSFGYENQRRGNPQEKSSLLLCSDRLWSTLAAPGQRVEWVIDDSKMVERQGMGQRRVVRHGWDVAARCLLFTTIDDRPNRFMVRPEAYKDFTDQEVLEFVGSEWPESIQGARPNHTECWVAIGPVAGVEYQGPAAAGGPAADAGARILEYALGPEGQTGARHSFAAQDGGTLAIGIGSTRQGALAELNAAREGQDLPRQRQAARYEKIRRRAPRLTVAGHPVLEEIASLIPPFLESLKTGFVLMRSRPHTGAVCGGWDQLMIATPMVRAGDGEMTPRYLEHWLHQVALDGQIFHVSDVDLSPAVLFKRWDLDDFMYLIVAAQWIASQNDRAMLERLAAKCTHMLRVMLAEADPQTGLIASRGIYPDWPPLETGRTGITWPSLENGLWYEALRWWEGLAVELGEQALHTRLVAAADKIRAQFAALFLDPTTGMIWDAVRPQTHEPVRTFSVWALSPFQGSFGHELFTEEQTVRIAQHVATAHLDRKFPYVRSMVGADFPFALERIHWPLFDHLVAKSLRRGNCPSGLNDLLEIIERQYRWWHSAVEAMNAYNDVSHELLSQTTAWFGWGASGWYEALLAGVAGIWEEPGGLAYVCSDQQEAVQLSNLPYRGGVWDIAITGAGRYLDRFEVDGRLIPGVAKIPEPCLTTGAHTLRVHRSDQPGDVLLLDSVGLRLIDAASAPGALRLQLAGPGRAVIRFHSATKPLVRDRQGPVPAAWDPATQIGRVEISRGATAADLTIGLAPGRGGKESSR